jgi:cobalt-precorrin 5A hydrolase
MSLRIAIVTINQPSLDAACKLVPYLSDYTIDVYGKKELTHDLSTLHVYNKLDDILEPAWKTYDAIICILAMGAVVRKIAPLLEDKATDPAVIVMNLNLDKVIPLLSGHLGGANALSDVIASRLPNCINFISTATDQTNTLAFEMFAKQEGLHIENLKELAAISNALLNKKEVQVQACETLFDTIDKKEHLVRVDQCTSELCVNMTPFKSGRLSLKPKVYLGIGCNRGTSCEEIEEAFIEFLKQHGLKASLIQNIASFEAKADEEGLLKFAQKYEFDIQFFNETQINALQDEFTASKATQFFNVKGVAEPSSILISRYKHLIIKKEVYNKKITLAGAI